MMRGSDIHTFWPRTRRLLPSLSQAGFVRAFTTWLCGGIFRGSHLPDAHLAQL